MIEDAVDDFDIDFDYFEDLEEHPQEATVWHKPEYYRSASSLASEEGEITSVEDDSVASKSKRQKVEQSVKREFGRGSGREVKTMEVRKMQRPRILKSDFRRNYSTMWADMFNCADIDMLTSHLKTFYHPDLVFTQTVLLDCGRMPPMFCSQPMGIEFLHKMWSHYITFCPDLICSIKHTMLKVRGDGTSSIRCSFELNATMIVSADIPDDVQQCVTKCRPMSTRIGSTVAAVAAIAPDTLYFPHRVKAEQIKAEQKREQKEAPEVPFFDFDAGLGLGDAVENLAYLPMDPSHPGMIRSASAERIASETSLLGTASFIKTEGLSLTQSESQLHAKAISWNRSKNALKGIPDIPRPEEDTPSKVAIKLIPVRSFCSIEMQMDNLSRIFAMNLNYID
mmetsp:Transcript_32009/g.70528  ORF Transcript_32009/g.70528 Transcript_32009/m.70528 type:complete len:395 (+) Transcript_32009:201-1385(+)|eukprot:CAMPEP_0173191740 /NCGR_PEP_ID=MMETSP1141-20130122/13051_1 /TAXON_ID=483371 /ORGANISM="non described non described, Strain CCMP2298" /LENGTH=394 /DNA_ID=CAMNT_0014115959 /DNA_START=172 /DNA_END=1356 /DNA_ORIENTATION=+